MRIAYVLAVLFCIAASVPAADCPGGVCAVKKRGNTVVQVATVGAVKAKPTVSTHRTSWRPGKLLGRLRGCR